MESRNFDEESTIIIFIILFQLPVVTGINEINVLKIIIDDFKDYYIKKAHKYIIYDILRQQVNTRDQISMDREIDTSIYGMRCFGCARGDEWNNMFTDLKFISERNFFLERDESGKLFPASIGLRAKYIRLYRRNSVMLDYRNFVNEAKRKIISDYKLGSVPKYEFGGGSVVFPKSKFSIIVKKDGLGGLGSTLARLEI